jgi:GT2 family glycosyltransferase
LLRELANSFLVLAYNGDRDTVRGRLGVEDGWVARHYSLDRHPAFCKRTSLEQTAAGLTVRNTAAAAAARPAPASALTQRLEDEPFRPGHQLLLTLHEHAAAGRLPAELPSVLAELHEFLVREYGAGRTDSAGVQLLNGEAIDVTPWNIVVDPESGEWHSIDGEWRFEGVLPVDYVLWRGLHHAAARSARLLAGAGSSAVAALTAVRNLLPAVTTDRLGLYEEIERFVQRAAGAEASGQRAEITPRMRELVGEADAPAATTVTVLAHAEELIERPELVTTFANAFAGGRATLVAYAPDADPAELAPRLEAVLAGGAELEVVLLAVPREAATEERLAASADALLSDAPAAPAFASLPRIEAGAESKLRAVASPAQLDPELPPEATGPVPCVSIVIPVFNRLDLTRQCLEAIRATTPEPAYEVIVVDNASTDGTAEFLRDEQAAGRIRCVINPENTGFGGACNQGAELARGEFLLLLNNDTIPQAGWLAALVETMADPAIGIVGSRLLYPTGLVQHAGIVWNAQRHLDHIHRGVPGAAPAVLVPRDFAAVTGACLIIRREVFFVIGAFDRAYHMYVEDVDLCFRAWEAGLRVTYCPSSVVIHLENASVTDIAWRDRNVEAGWEILEQRWAGRWPDPVRRLAWPHTLSGSRKHLAVLCFADDVLARPELLSAWSRTFAPENAMLVVWGPGYEPAMLAGLVDGARRSVGLADEGDIDLIVLAAPAGTAPPSNLVLSIGGVLSTDSPREPELAGLPWADEDRVASLKCPPAGVALVA